MHLHRQYNGWDPSDPLDPEAEAVLSFVEDLACGERAPASESQVVATIDEYGVVIVTVPIGDRSELFLQAGDGWDRVVWTCPSGRVFEWVWDDQSPEDICALLDGHGVERTVLFGRRAVASQLVVNGKTLVTADGAARLAVLRRVGLGLTEKDQPAL
jgi:hypothetical protein